MDSGNTLKGCCFDFAQARQNLSGVILPGILIIVVWLDGPIDCGRITGEVTGYDLHCPFWGALDLCDCIPG